MSQRNAQARRLRNCARTFRYICGILAFLSLLFVLGTVGSIDVGELDLSAGSIRLALSITAFALFGRLSGAMK